ncbi:S1 domain-containing post-transcriptional regulator GSP13 [Oceanobacillus picturae]|jgi:general stress protein 13|uniref:S1 domain-containing post-transcriptional regulator GSP13 n=1 Tax=Oceanobacillus picturae TaxID=171693 RepID=UPI000E67859D|nr:S1 domain-containing post-transcriptional regulator GSP13 [Oceanobacillus picturae]RIU94655.1 general stress protein 13 [Oceanobacillus picturae]
MTNKFEVGQILDGKVTGIQPYGAFVALDEETQGLVHISEVTHGFVKDINEHLTTGDEVKVKVLTIDEEKNKVSLSIRATEEAPKKAPKPRKQQTAAVQQNNDSAGFNTLKDKLEEWIEQSGERDSFKK